MAPEGPDLERLLERLLGPGARFRTGQREAIEAVLAEGARVQLVQATGWGKSVVYWLATRVLRDRGRGPTLIISPLLALMRDQVRAATRLGLRAVTVNSSNRDDWRAVLDALGQDEVDVLLISPERLANDEFRRSFIPAIQGAMGLFVVDEVHCISDWGHDFRPDYRRIGAILSAMPPSVPVLGTTATANSRVRADVAEQLGPASTTIMGSLARESLRLGTVVLADQSERLAWLAEWVPKLRGDGIVYCLTVADTERVAGWLTKQGIDARAYSGQMDAEQREELERALLDGEVKALVATVALGMGFDKPDLGWVIHYQRPGSVVAYYQQVGRAGRAVDDAYGILLSGREDDEIIEYFIESAFPPTSEMLAVLEALERVDTASVPELMRRLNLRMGRTTAILKLLEVDGAVERSGSRYHRTLMPWEPDEERIERVTALRREELEQMRRYVAHDGCLMAFLLRALDDENVEPCGRCMSCRGRPLDGTLDEGLVREANWFLRRSSRPIAPRSMWTAGAVPGLRGKITLPNEEGVALSIYGDAGWGTEVAQAKHRTGRIPEPLIEAAVEAIRERWDPHPDDGWWVTAIPSHRHPGLVGHAAQQIAVRLGLPYRDDVISISNAAPRQTEMENSVTQLRNVHASLGIHEEPLPGPVILVDDIVDSRWMLTMAGHLLRSNGAGAVHPFAFAEASSRVDG